MNKKYSIIVCDPPWAPADQLSMSSTKRGASANYSTMTTDELCALPVKDIADPDGCILALWCLGSMLEDGMRMMKSFGFTHKQIFVWCKSKQSKSLKKIVFKDILIKAKKNPLSLIDDISNIVFNAGDWLLNFGMGHLFRQSHEICLIGINNNKIYSKLENKSQRSVCFEENKGHSIKPEILQDRLEIMFPQAKMIEMFARRQRKNWTCLGNEIDGLDIKVSLSKLIDNV